MRRAHLSPLACSEASPPLFRSASLHGRQGRSRSQLWRQGDEDCAPRRSSIRRSAIEASLKQCLDPGTAATALLKLGLGLASLAPMKITSWNVNGLRAVAKKGFHAWLEEHDPDVLLLQETKAQEDVLPAELREVPGYVTRFHSAEKKGYSGVAVLSRYDVDEWLVGLGDQHFDCEGRVLGARFGNTVVLSAYFPNSQSQGKRIDYKIAFCDTMLAFLDKQLQSGRHIVLGGDYNIAHQPIDLARPKENEGSPGYLPEEREWMGKFLAAGYADVWRERNPDKRDAYSWWSYRTRARERNIGWRIDYLCVDEGYRDQVRDAAILMDVEGSDHCPVTIDIKNPV